MFCSIPPMALLLQTPIEFLGHMQRTYDRALAMYGKEAGCYVPPKMLEEDLKESLRFVCTVLLGYCFTVGDWQKFRNNRLSHYPVISQ